MNKNVKVATAIIGAGLIASITTAAAYFPDIKVILIPAAGLVSAVISYITGKETE